MKYMVVTFHEFNGTSQPGNEEFEEAVQEYLDMGWRLAGGVSIAVIPGEAHTLTSFAQAMTLGEEDE